MKSEYGQWPTSGAKSSLITYSEWSASITVAAFCQKLGITRAALIRKSPERIAFQAILKVRHSIILKTMGVISKARINTYGPKPNHRR